MIDENFSNLMKNMNIHIQEAQQIPSLINSEFHNEMYSTRTVERHRQRENPRTSKRAVTQHVQEIDHQLIMKDDLPEVSESIPRVCSRNCTSSRPTKTRTGHGVRLPEERNPIASALGRFLWVNLGPRELMRSSGDGCASLLVPWQCTQGRTKHTRSTDRAAGPLLTLCSKPFL